MNPQELHRFSIKILPNIGSWWKNQITTLDELTYLTESHGSVGSLAQLVSLGIAQRDSPNTWNIEMCTPTRYKKQNKQNELKLFSNIFMFK